MNTDDIIRSARIGLTKSKNPVKHLSYVYNELFGYNKKIFSIISGLLKRYKPDIILEAIIEYYDEGNKSLVYYCEVKFNQRKIANSEGMVMTDLNEYMKRLDI